MKVVLIYTLWAVRLPSIVVLRAAVLTSGVYGWSFGHATIKPLSSRSGLCVGGLRREASVNH